MRIVHISDTHIGRKRYGLAEASAKDFYDAFLEAFQKALDHSPDVIVHTGDVLDTYRVSTHTLKLIVEKLLDFSRKVPILISPGNHDFPVSSGYSPLFYFSVFEDSNVFTNEFGDVLEKGYVEPTTIKDANFYILPYIYERELLSDILDRTLENLRSDALNFILMHQIVDEVPAKFKRMSLDVPHEHLRSFKFKFLGHYHVPYMNQMHAFCYAGSTEALSYDEYAYDEQGFILEHTRKRIWIYEFGTKDMSYSYELLEEPRAFVSKTLHVGSLSELEQYLRNLEGVFRKPPIAVLKLIYDGDPLEVARLLERFEGKGFLRIIYEFVSQNVSESMQTLDEASMDFGEHTDVVSSMLSVLSSEDKEAETKVEGMLESYLEKLYDEDKTHRT